MLVIILVVALFIIINYAVKFCYFAQIQSKKEAEKEMNTLAIINFDIPGDAKFPLNALYGKPQDKNEAGKGLHSSFPAFPEHRLSF